VQPPRSSSSFAAGNTRDAEQTMLDKAGRLELHLSNLSFVGANALPGGW
jgi:hypothetical protein